MTVYYVKSCSANNLNSVSSPLEASGIKAMPFSKLQEIVLPFCQLTQNNKKNSNWTLEHMLAGF